MTIEKFLRKHLENDAPKPRRVKVHAPRSFSTLEALRTELAPHKGQGWLCLTSSVVNWSDSSALADGIPLSGEIALDANRSVHLRQSGAGWTVIQIDEGAEGDDVLGVEETFVVSGDAGANRMRYTTYWKARQREDGIDVYEVYVSRFLGWVADPASPEENRR